MRNRVRTTLITMAALGFVTVSQAVPSQATSDSAALANITSLASEAYIWGLAPEFVHRFSNYQELVSAPVNTLKYGNNEAAWNNNATNAGDSSVLYINSFIDFNAVTTGHAAGEPMVLTVPASDGQFYVANYLDAFVNGIGSIGNRTTPNSAPVSYVLVSPTDSLARQTHVMLNGVEYPVMASDTNVNWLLVRIRANSLVAASDASSVASVSTNVVQKFALNSLSQFTNNGNAPVFPTSYANLVPTPQQVTDSAAWKSAPTDAVAFFGQVGAGLSANPLPTSTTALSGTPLGSLPAWLIPQFGATTNYVVPAYPQADTLTRFAPIGLSAAGFTVPTSWGAPELAALQSGFDAGVSALLTASSGGTASATTNFWSYINNMIGTYPNTPLGYLTRGIVVLAGGSANVPIDAVYPTMNSNDGVAQLDGNNTYSMTFTPPPVSYPGSPVTGILPPMVLETTGARLGYPKGFWSIVIYQPDSTSSSAPFISQASVLNQAYSDPTSTAVVSVSGNTLTVNTPTWGPIEQSSPLIFGSNAADYGLQENTVYYVATQPTQPSAGTYAFQVSKVWSQVLSPGNVPIQQSGSIGGTPGPIVNLLPGAAALKFGIVQPVSQLGSDQLAAGNLAINADGSLTIWIGPSLPQGAAVSNWIPTPSAAYFRSIYGSATVGTGIQAMVRMYYPTPGGTPPSILPFNDSVSTTYVLPPLVKFTPASTGGGQSDPTSPATVPTPVVTPIPIVSNPVATPEVVALSTKSALPRNPITTQVLSRGVIVVGSKVASRATNRVMKNPTATKIGKAPTVISQRGHLLGLVAVEVNPSRNYLVRIKVNGKYLVVGTVQSKPDGTLDLPVLRLNISGTYPVTIVPTGGGTTRYLKVKVAK